jgi:hypothetical protein
MDELSVLAPQNDPYRLDTPAYHRDGLWLAMELGRLRILRPMHLRGLHYILASAGDVIRPNGDPYINDDSTWTWFSATAAKAARWLGYVGWGEIRDERNEAPTLHLATRPGKPFVGAWFDIHVDIPDDVAPTVYCTEFAARQAYQLYLIGEKSSLGSVLGPVAKKYGATLALPTGEISDSQIHTLASHMAEDGRPAIVFYFSDADPAGWQMPISVARKLQAFRDLRFPDLSIQVHPVALTPEQVESYGLPSTPLKESERRADRWKTAFGIEQTEIDSLAALRPDLLRDLAEKAIEPYWDGSLQSRCSAARNEHQQLAEAAFAERADADMIAALRIRAEATLDELREKITALREEMRSTVDSIDLGLPDPVVPEPIRKPPPSESPIWASDMDWAEATRLLRERKAYANGAGR